MNIEKTFEEWSRRVDDRALSEMGAMTPDDVADAFYKDLEFGTGGLRGRIGIGPNRMNSYTVSKATQGVADYLNSLFEKPRVALCRDTRHGGEDFLHCAVGVFAANGIRTVYFDRVEPTPALSYAVRRMGCEAGVNITASHNPAIYNGYKVYGSDGCQITVSAAKAIQSAIDAVDPFEDVKSMSMEQAMALGLTNSVPESVLDAYIAETLEASSGVDCSSLRVSYTPLHGVGLECVSRILDQINVTDISRVETQCIQDGDFPTCPYPNPEIRDALKLGIECAKSSESDILIATDPDADRLGVAVLHDGGFELLSGNEVGLLLLEFVAERSGKSRGSMSQFVACTTVVSSPMADAIAQKWGFELRRTLTGFKFIGEQIGLLEAESRENDFLMGFEESYGYLAGTSVRDKDAVVTAMLVCELAAYWKSRGLDLFGAMERLYDSYGYWASSLLSVAYEGPEGSARMRGIMSDLRCNPPRMFADVGVSGVVDYLDGAPMPIVNGTGAGQLLPPANVFEMRLVDGSRVIIRPSGTEPKIKSYIYAKGSSREDAKRRLAIYELAANGVLRRDR